MLNLNIQRKSQSEQRNSGPDVLDRTEPGLFEEKQSGILWGHCGGGIETTRLGLNSRHQRERDQGKWILKGWFEQRDRQWQSDLLY
jgi:hypothetical protein